MILDIVHYSQGLCHWFYGKIHIWRKAPTYLACNYSKHSFFAMNMCNWKFHLQNELGLERFQGNFLSTCFWSIFQKKTFLHSHFWRSRHQLAQNLKAHCFVARKRSLEFQLKNLSFSNNSPKMSILWKKKGAR